MFLLDIRQYRIANSTEKAWARSTPPNATNAALYMVLQNNSSVADVLLEVETPAARTVELHAVRMEMDMMFMKPLKNILVSAHGKAVLEPAGNHMMLVGLKEQLKVGNHLSLTLKFKYAGVIKLMVPIKKRQKDLRSDD